MAVSLEEEKGLRVLGYNNICGIDDTALGCFAGAVLCGAVIFPADIDFKKLMPGLNDSKKKTDEQRRVLYKQIQEHALAYATGSASVAEIDEMNIYWARFLAARRALEKLQIKPDYVLMDGNKEIPEIYIPQHAIVKGDAKSVSIAAASILAKVERDDHIDELAAKVHPDYEWIKNKSYYSPEHVAAIKKHGKTPWHRKKYVDKYLTEDQKNIIFNEEVVG
jgi:ribonuclease HII